MSDIKMTPRGAPENLDITNCDRELIHIPGSIQPHGVLLALDADTTVLQVSENVQTVLGKKADAVLSKPLANLVGQAPASVLQSQIARSPLTNAPSYLSEITVNGGVFLALAHQHDGVVILELEPATQDMPVEVADLQPFVNRLQGIHSHTEISQFAADEVRRITRYDRVLVYQFDSDWNGTVIAESRNENLPSYLDLRFPASDIPRQARDLYRKNRMRLIEDVDYQPAALVPQDNPKTGKPLDLSYSTLRSVSPVHREYMRNMETAASMSVSILREGELWGLLSCHNREPLHVPFTVRTACDFIGQILSLQLNAHERNLESTERVRLKAIESRLLARMVERDDLIHGLTDSGDDLLRFAGAEGAVVVFKDRCSAIGKTIPDEQVFRLVEWLSNEVTGDVFSTDSLSALYPPAQAYAQIASGLLAIRISLLRGTYVLWFRPEVIQTVRWSGDPHKPMQSSPQGIELHPRKSFEAWKETVRLRSRSWSKVEVESAADMRSSIVGIVLRKAEELAELTSELERSNKELETFSYSVSHDLRAPFRHIVGFSELLKNKEKGNVTSEGLRYIDNIIESAQYAGKLVDHLLELSRITRKPINIARVALSTMTHEVIRELRPEYAERKIEWKVSPLPEVVGDPVMLRLVLRNLLSNAVKYTRNREQATIEIGAVREFSDYQIWVRDNGVGFDMRYAHKLFGVFQRLHRQEEYEGTGIGLANVRRIVSRHRGRTWAEGELGKGATFFFSLPASEEPAAEDSSIAS
jgi:light-regulated signal transduction histidine kinase (bacteriophytochrome)